MPYTIDVEGVGEVEVSDDVPPMQAAEQLHQRFFRQPQSAEISVPNSSNPLSAPESAQSINRFFAQAAVDRQDSPNMAGLKGAWESLVTPQVSIPRMDYGPRSEDEKGIQPVIERAKAGLVNAGAGLLEFFTSPVGIATAGLGALPAAVGKVAGGLFAADLSRNLPEVAAGIGTAVGEGDVQKATELTASAAVQLAAIRGGTKHAIGEGIPVRPKIADEPRIQPEEIPLTTNEVIPTAEQAPVVRDEQLATREEVLPVADAEALPAETSQAVEAVPEGAVDARSKYDQITEDLKGRTDFDSPEFQKLWGEREALKNESGGMPPEPELADVGQGPGAKTYRESSKPEPAESYEGTGLKNAISDLERVSYGFDERTPTERQGMAEAWVKAGEKVQENPLAGKELADALIDNPKRGLTSDESALLLRHKVSLENALNDAAERTISAKTPEEKEAAQLQADEYSHELKNFLDAVAQRGSEWGREGRWRQAMAYEDYSFATQERLAEAAKGSPLTSEEKISLASRVREREAKVKELEAVVSEKELKISELEAQKAFDELNRTSTGPKLSKEILDFAEKVVSGWEKNAVKAEARLREKFARVSSGVDPTIVLDLVEMALPHIGRAGLDAAKWGASMVQKFGPVVEPYLKEAWEKAVASYDKSPAAKSVKTVRKKAVDADAQIVSATESIKEKIANKEADDIHFATQRLARGFVEKGAKSWREVTDQVHGVLKELLPDWDYRDSMDAISGHGRFRPPSSDKITKQLGQIKQEINEIRKIQEVIGKEPVKKSGFGFQEQSNLKRRLTQIYNEAKRKFGTVITDPARQLRSAIQATEKRLANQIADLEHEISTKSRIVREKTASPTSPEIESLKARRDALKTTRDELLGKRELTDAQRIAMATRAVEKSIEEYERRIKEGDIGPRAKVSKTPQTPALSALQLKREALRDQLKELHDLDATVQAEKYNKSIASKQETLKSQIQDLENRIKAGGTAATKTSPVNRPMIPELEPLRQQREALSAKIAEARKKPETEIAAERMARTLKSLNKSIAEKEAKLAARDTSSSTHQKINRPAIPEIEIAKQRITQLTQEMADLRKSLRPVKTPEERALQSAKTRMSNQIADLQERLDRKDFSDRPKRETKLDPEATALKYELEKINRKFHEERFKYKMANRTRGQKVIGTSGEILNTSRALLTSFDLSAVLRQGGFIGIGNPARSAKALPAMFKALLSEKNQFAIEQEIMSRPNAFLYKKAGLYLADQRGKLSEMEEKYASRWAEKIPGVAASARAYTTFLNKLRADSFDAMAKSLTKTGEPSPMEAKAIANYVNVATGRGKFGATDNFAVGLNTILFSPRYLASRFNLLTGQPLYGGTARTRTLIAKEYAKFLAGAAVVYGLASASGASIELDPRSTDFGKIRFGNARVDPMTGLLQNTILVSRIGSGEIKDAKGKVTPIRGEKVPFGAPDAMKVLSKFLRSKLAPLPAGGVDLAEGEDIVGNKVTPGSIAQKILTPIAVQDIYTAMKNEGIPEGTILGILAIFGAGVQDYDATAKRP